MTKRLAGIVAAFLFGAFCNGLHAEEVRSAIFAGGCFWCVESDFDRIPGVVKTISGYTGGTLPEPTYEQVSAGGTGHFEAVQITYDPARVSYAEFVNVSLLYFPDLQNCGQLDLSTSQGAL